MQILAFVVNYDFGKLCIDTSLKCVNRKWKNPSGSILIINIQMQWKNLDYYTNDDKTTVAFVS